MPGIKARSRFVVPPGGRPNRAARRVLLALAALALLGNIGFAIAADRLGGAPLLAAAPVSSDGLVLAVAGGDGRAFLANRAKELVLVDDGREAARTTAPGTVAALAVAPDGSRFYVGTADGGVAVLDAALAPTAVNSVSGRVIGLATTPAGGLLVGHGSGAFSDQYFVDHFPDPEGEAAFSTQVGFTIGALGVLGDVALFGTADSRVGAIPTGTGETAWTTTLRNPITRLLGVAERGLILAGDEDGGLTLLDAQGQALWTVDVGPYPVRGLAFDPASEIFFAGDARGTLTAVDASGGVRFMRQIAEADLEGVIPTGDGTYLAVPRTGSWQTLRPAALGATRLGSVVRLAWVVFDGALLVAATTATLMVVERWRSAVRRTGRAAWRARPAYALALPAILLIVLFAYYPTGMAFYYSLTNFSLRSATEFVGLDNYREVLLHDRYFRVGMVNMVIIVATSILKTITVPLLVAELIFWLRNGVHQYLFRILFVLPAVVPDLVFTLMWRQVYDPNTGLLNQLLGVFGLDRFGQAWLGNEATAIWAIVGVGFPFVGAFAFLICLGGLLNINGDYFDAAKVDGAHWWQRFLHLDLPLLRPQLRILLFFAITGTIQGFAAIFILTRGGPGTATYVPALQMYLRIAEGDFGYAAAVGVVLFVLILALTLFILRFRRDEAVEAG